MSSRTAITSLPRTNPPILAVGSLLAAGLVLVGVGVILEVPTGLLVLAGTAAVLIAAAVITTHVRSTRRQEAVDLCLLRIYGALGWPAPAREHLVASRWRGGWFGRPTRVLVRYNPVSDESFPEILGETKRVVERAFDTRYKLGKHKPRKGWFQLTVNPVVEDTS